MRVWIFPEPHFFDKNLFSILIKINQNKLWDALRIRLK
jgi:hypothetical protein